MLTHLTFDTITVRRALPSEGRELCLLAAQSRLERGLITPEQFENVKQQTVESFQPPEAKIDDIDCYDYVVETRLFNTAMPIIGSMRRQLAACGTSYLNDDHGENQWMIGWTYPLECRYPAAEALLAFNILQAKKLEASSLGADGAHHKEFFENKGLFHVIRGGNRMILPDYHYDAVLDHLNDITGLEFKL